MGRQSTVRYDVGKKEIEKKKNIKGDWGVKGTPKKSREGKGKPEPCHGKIRAGWNRAWRTCGDRNEPKKKET